MGSSGAIPLASTLQAELAALSKGIQLAVQHNLSPLSIETSEQEIINLFLNSSPLYDDVIFECRSLLSRLGA